MCEYRCPHCDGAFPEPARFDDCKQACPGHCPWCGSQLASTPLARKTQEDLNVGQ
jgi:hypothetical protein